MQFCRYFCTEESKETVMAEKQTFDYIFCEKMSGLTLKNVDNVNTKRWNEWLSCGIILG